MNKITDKRTLELLHELGIMDNYRLEDYGDLLEILRNQYHENIVICFLPDEYDRDWYWRIENTEYNLKDVCCIQNCPTYEQALEKAVIVALENILSELKLKASMASSSTHRYVNVSDAEEGCMRVVDYMLTEMPDYEIARTIFREYINSKIIKL